MKNIIAAVLFSWCCNALAGDLPDLGEPSLGRYELSNGQIAAETAFVGLMLVDYRQTMDINGWCDRNTGWQKDAGFVLRQPDGSYTSTSDKRCDVAETNPLLGEHPSDVRIRNYFVGVGLAHVVIAKALPTEYRPYWIGAGIAVQLYTVLKNRKLGLSVNF